MMLLPDQGIHSCWWYVGRRHAHCSVL